MKRIAGLEYCFFTTVVSTILTAIYTTHTYAATTFENPLKVDSLGELLINILDGFVTILIPVMVLAIVYTGFRMVIHSESQKYKEYGQSLLWAFLGLFIVLGAKGILVVISNTVAGVLSFETTPIVQPDILLAVSTLLPYTIC